MPDDTKDRCREQEVEITRKVIEAEGSSKATTASGLLVGAKICEIDGETYILMPPD